LVSLFHPKAHFYCINLVHLSPFRHYFFLGYATFIIQKVFLFIIILVVTQLSLVDQFCIGLLAELPAILGSPFGVSIHWTGLLDWFFYFWTSLYHFKLNVGLLVSGELNSL